MGIDELLELMRDRRSIRSFHPRSLDEGQVDALIEALMSAPSAGNLQSRGFFIVSDKELQRELADAALGQDFLFEAPLVIVCCTDDRIRRRYGERGTSLYMIMDVAASVQNALLAAHAMELGACWVGAFNEEPVRRLLELPSHLRPVALIPVGYTDESPYRPPQMGRDEAVDFVV